MAHDPGIPRFMAYLSLFTFFMLALVTANDFVQLFFGWEGVGLLSYLLIGFWYDRRSANDAAIKAFIVNRVGDFGFALGIFTVFVIFGSLDFSTVFGMAPGAVGTTINFLGWQVPSLTLACILLFVGAMGKSAQFLLHTWLPDAMEGPTPVSALIHAATMVTAGVFMVARLSPLFELAPNAQAVVMFFGATTAFFAATVGLVQNDIMCIGTLSLTGFPFFAGYFSKDAIIESAFASHNPLAFYGFLMTVIAAGLTSFYSWRLVIKTFLGEPHDQEHYEAAHESPLWMLIPIGILAAGSIFAGFPFKELFAGHGVEEFFRESVKMHPGIIEEMHHIPDTIAYLPTIMMAIGAYVAYAFYVQRPYIPVELARQHQMLYHFLLNKWYFDELYDLIFVRPAKRIGRFLWKVGDGYIIDGFGPDGVSARVLDVTRNVVRLQTGYLYHYAFAMLIGVAGLITWFMFGAGVQ